MKPHDIEVGWTYVGKGGHEKRAVTRLSRKRVKTLFVRTVRIAHFTLGDGTEDECTVAHMARWAKAKLKTQD